MPRKDPEKCNEIRDRVSKWEKYWTINRVAYYEWVEFILGTQWLEDESKLFERYNKMPLQVNKLGVLYNHVIGDQIQNTPNLQISPDEDVPVDTATARAALIKNISLNSDAKSKYQKAFGQAIVGGYGACRIGTDYLHEKSFDQEIKIFDFDDPNQCYFDVSAKHPCKVDGMFAGFKTSVSRDWFRDQYGKDIEQQIGSSAITEDTTYAFSDNDSITIVDDFKKEGKKVRIRKLSNGMTVDDAEFKALEKVKINGKRWLLVDGAPVSVVETRDLMQYTIKHTQIAGDFILEETDFPAKTGQILPIFFLDQRSYYTKSGQQMTRSFFKDVKDAQRYLNYIATQSAYMMKISRYDQFIMPRKCAAAPDSQQQWQDPSIVNGALFYDETPSGAKPEQLRPPELSQSLMEQYQRTLLDIQSGTGLYNSQLGDVGDEASGVSIRNRNRRGDRNTQIPRASVDMMIATMGELINDMIPVVYDTERALVLPMPDSAEERVMINSPADPYGLQIQNDMTEGRFKIRIKPGLSYEGQKEEALESLQLVLNADQSGQVFPMIADLYAENLPLDNNLEIRNRLRTLVSPAIIEAGKTGKPLPPKPQQPDPQMLMVQLKQQELQQKSEQAQNDTMLKMKDIDLKKAELQRKALETHQDMTMQFEKLEADRQEAAASLQETILRYQAEMQNIQNNAQMNHANNLVRLLTHNPKHEHSNQAGR